MTAKGPEVERLVAQWVVKIQDKLGELLPTNPTEEELRLATYPLLDSFCVGLGIKNVSHAEHTLATGRADATFNRFVIEYKRPGYLKKIPDKATYSAIGQLRGYIQSLAEKERSKTYRLAGVVFDGHHVIFVRYVNGKWTEERVDEVNQHTLGRLLVQLSGTAPGIALTSEYLARDFSMEQPRAQKILDALYTGLNDSLADAGGIVQKLFEQWKLFFSESIDYSRAFGGRKLEPLKKWAAKAGIVIKTVDESERFFFALHTYFALLVKFLAWAALDKYAGGKLGGPTFWELGGLGGEELKRRLRDMEDGGIFHKAYGIENLLEGDFFQWYLTAWNAGIEEAVRGIVARLDDYDPATLSAIPEETRDLFKKLYHYLLPRVVRHNLGEYYTPDWLAKRLLNQVDYEFFNAHPESAGYRKKLLNTRFLDPACGSGTFPVLIIARMIEAGRAIPVPGRDLLDAILQNVKGIDLNPLAVLTARVNYILAIADLLPSRGATIEIPIYLADSVRTPAVGEEIFSEDAYEFPTAIGKFHVPAELCAEGRFDGFCTILEECVDGEFAVESFMRRVENELDIGPEEWDTQARSKLITLFERMVELHRAGMNGLWARLLKNNFAPLTMGLFDYVVGNPPWVNWEHLPDNYRKSIAPLWGRYNLFSHKGFDAILGKSKDDISVLMTYVVIDKLLKDGGRLGFVITQSVFKTAGGGVGFRRFNIPKESGEDLPLRVLHVDDMASLNPFEGASNRTAVVVIEKGKQNVYPVAYTLWRKKKKARFSYDSELGEVVEATERLKLSAEPVNAEDPTSSWLTAHKKALKAIRKVLGKSDYRAREGVNSGGANAVYWVEIVDTRPDGLVVVRNVTKGAKVKVDETIAPLEPDLLYPLLRGRDVRRWKADPSAFMIVTHKPGMRLSAIPEKDLQVHCPKTYAYLKGFEKVLRSRASRGVSDMLKKGAPFYTMFAVGDYTFAPWKVVWREVGHTLDAAVTGFDKDKITVADHTLITVSFESEEEAHYLCGFLNSSPSRLAVQSYIVLHPDTHILKNVRIPKFNPKDKVHQRLAELSQEAHEAAKTDDTAALEVIEAEIDAEAARIWGLTGEELTEIQRSLDELTG